MEKFNIGILAPIGTVKIRMKNNTWPGYSAIYDSQLERENDLAICLNTFPLDECKKPLLLIGHNDVEE
jgi:hypothetical protein